MKLHLRTGGENNSPIHPLPPVSPLQNDTSLGPQAVFEAWASAEIELIHRGVVLKLDPKTGETTEVTIPDDPILNRVIGAGLDDGGGHGDLGNRPDILKCSPEGIALDKHRRGTETIEA